MTLQDDLNTLDAENRASPNPAPQESKSLWECRLCLDDVKAQLVALQATYDAYVAAHP